MNNSTDPQQKQAGRSSDRTSTEHTKQGINTQDFECQLSENTQTITATLPPPKTTSDIRPEKVKMAQKLIQNPHYPTSQHLDKVADALLNEIE
ncbi:MAG: hypothetical protein LBF43_03540 [Puniceicoccales bacterium]|jgi:anti-sigma28 factor (negative regulator of flagellin synthesis)|nr:hypothetical protein [Puniceicoccales bacterium]